jgi:prepilin-type N-terminal cleavage/methylation domain-containing protein
MKRNRHAAFTLMELMISIALALILVLGINEVFGLTAKTIGAGQALASAYQADRGTQVVMANDFKNMVNNAPLLITSCYQPAFRSPADQAANQSTNPDIYNPIGQNITYPLNALSPRVIRLDTISFCARDLFQRQTGGVSGAFITPGSSYEAYVWYGHLNIGDNTMPAPTAWSTSTLPGVGTNASGNAPPPGNPNNYYASQWVLGRVALLFQQTTTAASVSGVEYGSTSSVITGYQVQQSRFDVVSGTAGSGTNEGNIDAFTADIYAKAIVGPAPAASNWWGGTNSSNMSQPAWLNYRFQCQPKPVQPLTTDEAAFFAPAFVTGCSQFCVEFAGDYVSQNADGTVNPAVPAGPDGAIDFNIVNGVRQIRWYGMPRSVIGDGTINYQRGDVVRVQDVPGTPPANAPIGNPQPYTFEKMASSNTTTTYVAAWHPLETNNPRPKLIRITWAVEDPNSRLGLPVSFEYVFAVP